MKACRPFTGTLVGCTCYSRNMQRQQETCISLSIHLNMFADVVNCLPGYSALPHGGEVGRMFAGHQSSTLSVCCYRDILL